VAGKPHGPFVNLVVAAATSKGREIVAVVGDRPSTDGATARRLGVPFGLVLSGVTGRAPRGPHTVPASAQGPVGEPILPGTAAGGDRSDADRSNDAGRDETYEHAEGNEPTPDFVAEDLGALVAGLRACSG